MSAQSSNGNTIIMILIYVTLTLINSIYGQSLCPSMCNCIWRNGKQTALCERQGLIAVPTGITSSTQVLHLNGNNFQILPSRVFQERGLINLQKIFLSECKLGEIARDAFVQLTNLVELDLSGNLLTSVPSLALTESLSLRRLLLNNNPIRVIKSEAFYNLTNLVFLDLSSCQIDIIEPHAFRGVSKLEFLKLESNRLQMLAPTVVADLPALYSLDLHMNQWNCDCELRPAREWMLRNNVPQSVPPSCTAPKRLAGSMWNSIEIDEFACAPQFHTKTTDITAYIGSNVTISCIVSGVPTPSINWFSDDGSYRNLSHSTVRGDRFLVHEERNGAIVTSVMTITGIETDDSQKIICIAENRGGASFKNFTITVLQFPTPSPSNQWAKVEIAGALMGILFVFILVLLLVMIILLRARRASVVHHQHISGPKLALQTIDVLQNVENADRKTYDNTNTLSGNKPEIALISSASKDPDHHQSNSNGKDSNGSSSGYGSGLLTPDVAKTGNCMPQSQSNYLLNGGPRINLVTTVAQQNYHYRPQIIHGHSPNGKIYNNYSYNNYHNYQDVFDDGHMNLPPPPPPDDSQDQMSYKNYDPTIYDANNYPHCYTNAALSLNNTAICGQHQCPPDVQPNQWTELDLSVSKLMVQPAIVRYSPDIALNVNNVGMSQNQQNVVNDFGLTGTQV